MFRNDFSQVLAVDEFHHQVMDTLVLTRIVGDYDVGMYELGRRPHFSVEPLDRLGRVHRLGRQHLQCHDPFHGAVPRLEHLPHAARTNLLQDGVLAKHQALGLAPVDGFGLVLRELLSPDEFAGKTLGVLGTLFGRQALLKRRQLLGREEAALGEVFGELFRG